MDIQSGAHSNLWSKLWKKQCDLTILTILKDKVLNKEDAEPVSLKLLHGRTKGIDQITEETINNQIHEIEEWFTKFHKETDRVGLNIKSCGEKVVKQKLTWKLTK